MGHFVVKDDAAGRGIPLRLLNKLDLPEDVSPNTAIMGSCTYWDKSQSLSCKRNGGCRIMVKEVDVDVGMLVFEGCLDLIRRSVKGGSCSVNNVDGDDDLGRGGGCGGGGGGGRGGREPIRGWSSTLSLLNY
jgi:hypothetical protein